jgi:hypothetical protein
LPAAARLRLQRSSRRLPLSWQAARDSVILPGPLHSHDGSQPCGLCENPHPATRDLHGTRHPRRKKKKDESRYLYMPVLGRGGGGGGEEAGGDRWTYKRWEGGCLREGTAI